MGKPAGRRITIRDVAADAAVSVSAVSKVLRDAYGVSPSLRERVLASMAKLNYRPQTAARGMRGKTYTLGVLLPDLHNPFFTDIMEGMTTALERTQYQSLLGVSQSVPAIEKALVEDMIDRRMDGLVIIGPRMDRPALLEIAERIPTVVVGHFDPDSTGFDTVNNDDRLGAGLAVRHLVESGYRNVVMLSLQILPAEETLVTTQRELGYRDAMVASGQERHIKIVRAEQMSREVHAVARELLTMRRRPDAIFCWTDFIALDVLSVATQLGLSVPADIAVVGYDNTSYCDLAQNSLTSVDQSGQILGLQAGRLLTERIRGRSHSEHFVVQPRLVARNSSSPVRK